MVTDGDASGALLARDLGKKGIAGLPRRCLDADAPFGRQPRDVHMIEGIGKAPARRQTSDQVKVPLPGFGSKTVIERSDMQVDSKRVL